MEEKKSGTAVNKVLVVIILLLCSIIIGGVIWLSMILGTGNLAMLNKTAEIQRVVKKQFLEDIEDESVLTDGAYKGMIAALNDPYAAYYTAEEYAKVRDSLDGKYAGIGAVLSKDPETGDVVITLIYENTPAEEAGLQVDDIIVSANGNIGKNMDLNDFVSHIRGEEGSKLSLVIKRGDEEMQKTLIRQYVYIPTVSYYMLDEDSAYLRITDFKAETEKEFKTAIEELKKEGMKDIVYDLRENPGGYVSSVTAILDYILPEGVLVTAKDKNGGAMEYKSDEEHKLDAPCVVLIDEKSASSSEIFAGAIRDFKYGTLLGKKTTGKGVIQNTFTLRDKSALKLTIAKYYTPSGECIDKIGIDPDVEVDAKYIGPDDEPYHWAYDVQILEAFEMLNSQPQ